MTGTGKAKGDRAEREAAALLAGLLGGDVRRLLGAGRQDDRGDLDVPGWTVQVADWASLVSALRSKPLDADKQAARSGTRGLALLRLRGGEFRVCMTPETWALLVAELDRDADLYEEGYEEGYEDGRAIGHIEQVTVLRDRPKPEQDETPHEHRWGLDGICPDCDTQHEAEPW